MPSIMGSRSAGGEAIILIRADTLVSACEMASNTGHDLLEKGPDGVLRGAITVTGK